MKLELSAQDGVSILTVTGPIDKHKFKVLKAGIVKLFKDGKNKIVLNFNNVEKMESEVIREIAILDITAKELAGKIALSGVTAELKSSIENFAKPPIIPHFAKKEEAIEFIAKAEPEEELLPGEMQKLLQQKDKEIKSLESQLKLRDPTELKALREENAKVKLRISELEQQLNTMIKQQRLPPDAGAVAEKIRVLEENVKTMTKKLKKAEPQAASKP